MHEAKSRPRSTYVPPVFRPARFLCFVDETPLLACALVLLLCFMVCTPMVSTGLDVNLPDTVRPERFSENKNQLSIAIKADGQCFVGPDWAPAEHVEARVRQLYVETPNKEILVKADRFLPYRDIRSIVQTVRDVGFRRVKLIAMRRGGADTNGWPPV